MQVETWWGSRAEQRAKLPRRHGRTELAHVNPIIGRGISGPQGDDTLGMTEKQRFGGEEFVLRKKE